MAKASAQLNVGRGFRQFVAKAALIIFRHHRPFHLVTTVQEAEPEGKSQVIEDPRIIGPGDYRARRHHGGDVAVHEARAGQIGHRDQLLEQPAQLQLA